MFRKLIRHPEIVVSILALVIFSFFSVGIPAFFTSETMDLIAIFSAEMGLLALGETLVLTAGELDLSVGSVFALSAWVYTGFATKYSLHLALAPTLVFSLCIGFIQGYLVTKAKVPSFIVTLAGLILWRGLLGAITRGESESYLGERTTLFSQIIAGHIRGFPIALLWFIGFTVIFTILLARTKFGNHVLAVGGNPTVARNLGVQVERTKILCFMLCSLMAALSSIMYFNRGFYVSTETWSGIELFTICASIVGGTMLGGGYGRVPGTALGAITVMLLRIGIAMYGVPPEFFLGATGVALVIFGFAYLKIRRVTY